MPLLLIIDDDKTGGANSSCKTPPSDAEEKQQKNCNGETASRFTLLACRFTNRGAWVWIPRKHLRHV